MRGKEDGKETGFAICVCLIAKCHCHIATAIGLVPSTGRKTVRESKGDEISHMFGGSMAGHKQCRLFIDKPPA